MRFLRRSLSGLFLLGVTLALGIAAVSMVMTAIGESAGDERRGGGGRERVFAVNVIPFDPQTQTPVLEVFGEVQSARVLDLRPSTGGTILSVHPNFQEGGRVGQGDLLVEIDPSNAETALAFAQADLDEAQAEDRDATRALDLAREELVSAEEQVTLRQRALQRQIDLVERGVGTEAALEAAELSAATARQAVISRRQSLAQAEARLDLAKARVDRRNIALAEADRNLRDTKLYAPFAGILTDVTLVQGGTVTANERVGQMVDARALEVAFRVSTPQHARLLNDAGELRDTPAQVTLDAFGIQIQHDARLTREAPVVGDGQTGRLLFASVDGGEGLRPGDFVQVSVEEPPLDRVARLPASALGPGSTILVLGEEDRLREETVQLIRRQGDDVLVQARGLRGDLVVAERSPLLGAGIKVRPLDSDDTAVPDAPAMVELDDDRRARLVAFVEGNTRMPAAAKQRVLERLQQPQVPEELVTRLESRMGS